MSPASLINSNRYPLGDTSSDAYRSLVEDSRTSFQQNGAALLPAFLTAQATAEMCAEASGLVSKAFFCRNEHNVYLDTDGSHPQADHPANRFLRTDVGSIAMDYFDERGPLRTLYQWQSLTHFIAQVVDVEALYISADPLGAVSVNVFAPGDAHAWHFDESRFTVTIMLQEATAGGHFEYVQGLRGSGFGDTAEISRVIDEAEGTPERLAFSPGTLSIFAGRHTLHRVSQVQGEIPRLVPVLTYAEAPGYRNSGAVRELFWGRSG